MAFLPHLSFSLTSRRTILTVFLLYTIVNCCLAFYVPGVAPVEFKKKDPIVVKAVKMTSTITQLPYSYYSLPFCKPNASKLVYKSENLGEVLRGKQPKLTTIK